MFFKKSKLTVYLKKKVENILKNLDSHFLLTTIRYGHTKACSNSFSNSRLNLNSRCCLAPVRISTYGLMIFKVPPAYISLTLKTPAVSIWLCHFCTGSLVQLKAKSEPCIWRGQLMLFERWAGTDFGSWKAKRMFKRLTSLWRACMLCEPNWDFAHGWNEPLKGFERCRVLFKVVFCFLYFFPHLLRIC